MFPSTIASIVMPPRTRPTRAALPSAVLALLALLLCGGAPAPAGTAADSLKFTCGELLTRPTASSVTVHVMANAAMDAYCEYGPDSAAYAMQTPVQHAGADLPLVFVLDGLAPDAPYWYRLRFRGSGATAYEARSSHRFRTQRRRGGPFSFAIEADPHLDGNTVPDLFRRTLQNVLDGDNDFLIDLGDTFMSEKLTTITADSIRLRHLLLRSFFDRACHSVPLYLVLGNHEGELGWRKDGTAASLPVLASTTRTALFPNPVPDGFYQGNAASEQYVGLRQNYYAWEWGGALLVVLDPYWYTTTKPGKNGDSWEWTLGREQYEWFAGVLERSTARFRFVFCHQIVGGSGEGRGGTEVVDFYEMGGRNADSSWGFDTRRSGWRVPVHQLMLDNHVNAFFHGHDHFFDRQMKDGIVYQLVPQPGNPNYRTAGQAANYGYTTGDIIPCSGYLRVTVGDTAATVAYVRSYLPADEAASRHNGDISFSYTIRADGGVSSIAPDGGDAAPAQIAVNYPNPFRGTTSVRYRLPQAGRARLTVRDVLGRIVAVLTDGWMDAGWHDVTWNSARSGRMPAGMYVVSLETAASQSTRTIMMLE
jgi:hypothetical protein